MSQITQLHKKTRFFESQEWIGIDADAEDTSSSRYDYQPLINRVNSKIINDVK